MLVATFSHPLVILSPGDRHDAESAFRLPETQVRGQVGIMKRAGPPHGLRSRRCSLLSPPHPPPARAAHLSQDIHHEGDGGHFLGQTLGPQQPQQTHHHRALQYPLQPG